MRFKTLLALLPLLLFGLTPACATVESKATPAAQKGQNPTKSSTDKDGKVPLEQSFLLPLSCIQSFDCVLATPPIGASFEKTLNGIIRRAQTSRGKSLEASTKACKRVLAGYALRPKAPPVCSTPSSTWNCDRFCTANGLCTKDTARNGCVATSDAMCKRSTACATTGHCKLTAWGCGPASTADCRKTLACSSMGLCDYREGKCVAGSEADCQKAAACGLMGHCSLKGTRCVAATTAQCAASKGCKRNGMCSVSSTMCLASSDAMCKASTNCAQVGDCSLKDELCGPKTEADCLQSRDCKEMGYCGLKDDSCVPMLNAHCAQSTDCKEDGVCVFDAKTQDCIARDEP